MFAFLFVFVRRLNNFSYNPVGVIRNVEVLDYEKNHNHILQVVAYDCGMKRSEPVLVSVKVNRVCRLGWTGMWNNCVMSSRLIGWRRLKLCFVLPLHRSGWASRVHSRFRSPGFIPRSADQLVRLPLSTRVHPSAHYAGFVAPGQELWPGYLHHSGNKTIANNKRKYDTLGLVALFPSLVILQR